MWLRVAILLAALALAAPTAALIATAQEAPVAPAVPADAPPPPYEDQLLRLSEILGAVHYLRYLCDHDEKETWRGQMAALLDAEQPDEMRRARMIDRFNRGYESFRSVYRTCTAAAAESSDRYLQEGVRIAADITARYGK
jgi:uncharacterized protein (TIGR02301 family)